MSDRPTVLIVEEDGYLAGIYARKLEMEHCKVRVVESLDEARKKLKHLIPSVIILDVAIENRTGFDFIEEIKGISKLKKVPIVVITQLGDKNSVKLALERGATDYLIKGHFVPSEAAKKIKRIVYESQDQ